MLSWFMLFIFGFIIMYLINSLRYILGGLLHDPSIKASAVSAIVVLIITLILGLSLISVHTYFGSKNLTFAKTYLNSLALDATYCYSDLFTQLGAFRAISSISFYINPSPIATGGKAAVESQKGSESSGGNEQSNSKVQLTKFLSFSIGQFTNGLMQSFDFLQQFVFIPFTNVYLQKAILDLMAKAGDKIILVGLFLRLFGFTKDAGNLLLGFYISFTLILPYLYLIDSSILNSYYSKEKYSVINNLNVKDTLFSLMNLGVIALSASGGAVALATTYSMMAVFIPTFESITLDDLDSSSPVGLYINTLRNALFEYKLSKGDYFRLDDSSFDYVCFNGEANPDSLVSAMLPIELTRLYNSFGAFSLGPSEMVGGNLFNEIIIVANELALTTDKISYLSLFVLRLGVELAVLPVINIVLAVGFTMSLSQLLGSRVDLSGLIRVV